MIWLASYPRSGSTFLRIVLDEAYGIESSTFHLQKEYPVDEDYASYPVVKTHLLPDELIPGDPSIAAVYLVRDGRDCVVSLAHYRKQLLAPESDLEANLLAAIEAAEGSYFGGWSEHVRQWSRRAALVIRFEDLIVDPIGCAEQLRPWMNLPEPRVDRLPSFADLRSKDFKYGSGVQHGFHADQRKRWRRGKFRRGRVGAWEDELPERLHLRFLRLHGRELLRLGYVEPPLVPSPRESSGLSSPAIRTSARTRRARKRRVLIDASKLLDARMDGIRRYVQELLRAMLPIARRHRNTWQFDVRFGLNGTFPLLDVAEDIERGQPPLEEIPTLFRPDQMNPINACKQRLSELKGRISREVFRETVRLNYFKMRRSMQKRWEELKDLAESLAPRRKRPVYDLVHLTLPNTWQFYRDLSGPLLMTVHDLSHRACPQFQTASNNRSLGAGLQFARDADAHYIADSQATKEQMVRLLGVDPGRIAVVHLACNRQRFQPVARAAELERVRQKYGIPEEPYVLSVGTLEPRKNLINTVRAFTQLAREGPNLRANLIIAGSFGWGNAGELREAIESCPRIRAIGYVDERDLPGLYSGAAVFSYVSHYEGFGLPLLEAMGCGVPTLYGSVSSMPEVVGEAGLAAAPDDVQQIKQRLRQLLEDHALRRRLARQAVLRSLDFRWEKVAEQTFACYEHSIEARSLKAPSVRLAPGSDPSSTRNAPAPVKGGGRHAAA